MKSIRTFLNLLRNIIRSFRMIFRHAPWLTVTFSLASICLGLVTVLQNKILGNIVNKIVTIGQGTSAADSAHAALLLVLGYAGTMLAFSIISEIKLLADKIWTINLEHYLGNLFLEKRAEIDLAHYENPEFQNLMQKAFTQDVWPIYTLVEFTVLNIANLVVIAVTSTITTSISWHVYAVVILSAVPMFIVEVRYGSRVWGMWGNNSSNFRRYYSLRDHISNLDKIAETKVLQISGKLLKVTEGIMDDFRKERIKTDSARLKWVVCAAVISSAGFGYAFYYIVSEVLRGSLAAGTMVFLIASLTQLVGAISDTLYKTAEQYKRNLYVNDLFKVLDTEPYVTRSKNPVRLSLRKPAKITLEHVSFKYQGREDWILRDVSFDINPGERVALVGENGAGKSTLVKLLMRIYDPTEGRILIDGHDLKDIDHEEWLSYVSVLLQKYSTFEFNVGEAISAGRTLEKPQSDQLVERAARLSGAHEFVSGYAKGYGQQLGKEFDEGMEPSQGQEQKIALARTLYRLEDGFMVILDEPTAAIDPLAEAEIFEKMEAATAGKSLVLITHRFNTVKMVDKIVVIEHGQVQEIGNHSTLMQKKGRYALMFESQAKGFVEGLKV